MLNPYLEVVLATIIFGSAGVFVKYLALPATTMSFFRTFVPALVLGVYFLFSRHKFSRGNTKLMLVASVLSAVRMFFYFVAYSLTSIGNAVIVLYTWPVFATILSIVFLKEKVSRRNKALLFVAFIGIILVFLSKEYSFANKDLIGMCSMLVCALLYSFTFVIFKKESKSYSGIETAFFQNLVGAFVFLPFFLINRPFPSLGSTAVASVYGTLIGIVGFGLIFSALGKIKASSVSLLAYLEVLSGIAFGMVFFREALSWNVISGGILIIGSAVAQSK
jgi:drug/metabolite transporter (DMT)-like permease